MSSFDGRIKELNNVSVDCFEYENLYSTAYFLSHCHSDHMQGLRAEAFLNRLGREEGLYLYCSEITAHILSAEGKFLELLHKIKALPIGDASIVEVPSLNNMKVEITVTLIPTGHCPGAVMFLFEGEAGQILYTGDFRICEGDAPKFRQLHHWNGMVKTIDKLYLDTTFLSNQYKQFPSRADSIAILCELITSWLQEGPDNIACIQTSAKYGSEAVFIAVAKQLGMKIHIPSEAYNIYKNVAEIREAVTEDASSTRIHSCLPFNRRLEVDGQLAWLQCINKWTKLRIIKPCALSFTSEVYDGSLESAIKVSPGDNGMFRVCYSCHCSFRELEYFVKYLKPRHIEACVLPPKMKDAELLKLLRKISKWGNTYKDEPLLTLPKRRRRDKKTQAGNITYTEEPNAADMGMSCSALVSGEKMTTVKEESSVLVIETTVSEEEMSIGGVGNEALVATAASYSDAEIYKLIAEDLKPKVDSPDADIRRNMSLSFLATATALNKSVM